jgi:rubredoxin
MSGYEKRRRAASSTPWDELPTDALTPAQVLVAASHKSMYAFKHESFRGDIDFFNGYQRDTCPDCNSGAVKFGFTKTGIQRYRCSMCRCVFTPATGTIFEGRKLPLSAWSDFLIQVFSYASTSLMTREDRRSDTTLPYWMAKPNSLKTLETFSSRIEPGSRVVHDLERAHNSLVKKLRLQSERHDAKLLKGVPDELNPLEPVNRMCFLLKSFLRSHPGFDRADMQGYLDLFHVIMNDPQDKMEKATFVLDRAMRCPKAIRFWEHYNINSRSRG